MIKILFIIPLIVAYTPVYDFDDIRDLPSETIYESLYSKVIKTFYPPANKYVVTKIVKENSETDPSKELNFLIDITESNIPHTTPLLYFHVEDDFYYFGFEYYPRTLFSYLNDEFDYAKRSAQAPLIAFDILEGLAFLHKAGYTHNDLHDGNVLLDKYNRPFITDFGQSDYNLNIRGIESAKKRQERTRPLIVSDMYAISKIIFSFFTGDDLLYMDRYDFENPYKEGNYIDKRRFEFLPRSCPIDWETILTRKMFVDAKHVESAEVIYASLKKKRNTKK